MLLLLFVFVEQGLKGLFHPACLARVVSWFAFVVTIFMAHESVDKQRPVRRPTVKEVDVVSHNSRKSIVDTIFIF